MKNLLGAMIVLMFALVVRGQQVQIIFVPTWAKKALITDTVYLMQNDEIMVEELKFYISNIALQHKGKVVWQETNSYHLLDVNKPGSLQFTLTKPTDIKFDEVLFSLGIDSITSEAGVLDGDLDPTKGMYWTWQSGYIHVKLEGKSKHCPARKNRFQFHLGGFRGETNSFQNVSLKTGNSNRIVIELPVDNFLEGIELSKQYEIMIPGKQAVALSKRLASLFKLKTQ
ncbi:MAG TPA: hypothetical protein PL009_13680 [Flavipsychrobacter sp.]|nr:hypothetical protein [Flavipsychrobacter sp.]